MQKILVTGGSGFIGSALVRHILTRQETFNVLNIDKETYATVDFALESVSSCGRYQHRKIDIVDQAAVQACFREFQPDIVFHLAAESHVDRSIEDSMPFIESNILGTHSMLECTRQYVAGGAPENFRFLHISTDEVFGSIATGSATEDSQYQPNSPYSASKAASDHLVRAWGETYQLPLITTNCTNNYGPFQYPEKLIPLMILNALDECPLPVYGDGSNIRDWLFVEDHVEALWTVAQQGRLRETYNVSADSEVTNLQVVQGICQTLDEVQPRCNGRSYTDLIQFVTDRPGHDFRYSLSSEKLQTELGWQRKHSFEEGIRETVLWNLNNRDRLVTSADSSHLKRRGLAQ